MREPLENTFNYLGLPIQPGEGNGWWVSTKSTPEGMHLNDRTIPEALVPNVVDMGLKDALYLLGIQRNQGGGERTGYGKKAIGSCRRKDQERDGGEFEYEY